MGTTIKIVLDVLGDPSMREVLKSYGLIPRKIGKNVGARTNCVVCHPRDFS